MLQTERQEPILRYKLAYTAIILIIYLVGRGIPLYGIDISAYRVVSGNAEILLTQAIGGDAKQFSLFVLGMSPYMMASILVQILVSIRNAGTKTHMSPRRMNHIRIAMAMLFTVVQALIRVQTMRFRTEGPELVFTRAVAVIEMVTGVMLILWLSQQNEKYGIGGRIMLIYVNIVSGIVTTLSRHPVRELYLPLAVATVMIVVTLIMEGGEKRIPMQRISIYNIYADKNYLAIKLDPVGVMPVMFSTAFFMLPQLIVNGLLWLCPENVTLQWWKENLVLTRLPGIQVYIAILYFLTIGFAMMTISPKEIAEQFLKGGDSILGLRPGRETRRYLTRQVWGLGLASATVMSICIGIPMLLQLNGRIDQELVMFPSSVMMLTSLWYSLYQEFRTLKSFEAYRPFI